MAWCWGDQSPCCRWEGWESGTHPGCSAVGNGSWSECYFTWYVVSVTARKKLKMVQVMIVSYETLRTLQDELAGHQIGLLLADEGHRLKNAGESSQVSDRIGF